MSYFFVTVLKHYVLTYLAEDILDMNCLMEGVFVDDEAIPLKHIEVC